MPQRRVPAPATVPKLKKACMSGMSVLPISRSASAPSTFIITSTAPLPKPNRHEPDHDERDRRQRSSRRCRRGRGRPTTVTSTPIMPARAPTRAISHGAAMRPRTAAIEPARMTRPTPCVLSPVSSRTAGRRATQLARLSPERKKIGEDGVAPGDELAPRSSSAGRRCGVMVRPGRIRRLGAATSLPRRRRWADRPERAGGRLQCSRIDSMHNIDRRSDFTETTELTRPRHPLGPVTTMYGSPRRAP